MDQNRAWIIEQLFKADTDRPDIVQSIFDMARHEESREIALRARNLAAEKAKEHALSPSGKEFARIYWDIMLWLAPHDFDSYMLALERLRKPSDRFYQPRRAVLRPIVEALQALADDELDQLFISLPPRVGKTTLVSFFFTWVLGRDPEISNLYSSYSAYVTKTFYTGILEILNDPDTYCFNEIFPKSQLAATDAQDLRIDIGRKKKYPTLTCRSIDGALNGGADCQGYLCGDDLLEGIEEAVSPDRLAKKWSTVLNNLIPRQVGKRGKIIFVGTRWSLQDPIGKQIDLLENNPDYESVRYKVINLPAMDENDESNFDYPNGKGMTTAQYRQRRAAMQEAGQIADWEAQYCGQPVERSGQLFSPDMLRYYNGVLPEGECDRCVAYVDVAFGGGDYVAGVVARQFDQSVFITDVVFDNGDKYITRPLIVNLFKRNNVGSACFEGTRTTDDYREWIDNKLREDGFRINIFSKAASTRKRKEERIFEKAPEIREFYFLDTAHRSPEYAQFMRNLHGFTMSGAKHDDAPDALAGLCDLLRRSSRKAVVFERPF